MDDLKLFTREEVAELFNVHVATITMLKDAGVLSAIKIGKGYLFPKESIINFEYNYLNLDVSNMKKAIASRAIVESRDNI